MSLLCVTHEPSVRFTRCGPVGLRGFGQRLMAAAVTARALRTRLRAVTRPEPAPASPLKTWQWAELCALFLVIAVQLWLYQSLGGRLRPRGACSSPCSCIHVYFWMAPLVRQQRSQDGSDGRDHP